MLKHIVMLKLKDEAKGASAAENAVKLKTMLDALVGKIAEIRSLEVGINLFSNRQTAHLSLYAEFDSEEDLNRYANHPDHQRVVAFLQQVMDERRVVDYHA
ncbi:Dabb family protein [Desulfoluna sp.]|uniref:Dabb family protein n=1 Tax=Desulfoluna sp. TaxID=2045199 RepID=UPI0026351399|nr:Dabb family protein [Desulfoluna sp.]